MKTIHLTVIAPVDKALDEEAARMEVWARVSALLLSQLGRSYTRFEPAAQAHGQVIDRPYGVILGRSEPALFLYFYAHAKQLQEAAIEFHMKGLTENATPISQCKTEHTAVYALQIQGDAAETSAHLHWHLSMLAGELMPDCGLYFLKQKEAFASEELDKDVLSNMRDYALCVATLVWEADDEN